VLHDAVDADGLVAAQRYQCEQSGLLRPAQRYRHVTDAGLDRAEHSNIHCPHSSGGSADGTVKYPVCEAVTIYTPQPAAGMPWRSVVFASVSPAQRGQAPFDVIEVERQLEADPQ